MEIAGSPANEIPANARSTSSTPHRGAKAHDIVRSADASNEASISGTRPRASEIVPATISAGASSPVVKESGKLLSAALT